MKIIIDFNEATQEIVSVTIGNSTKTLKSKKVETTEAIVTLETNKLILSPEVINKLNVKEGDKLIVRYKQEGDFIEPFLGKPEAFSEVDGNKLTKQGHISFRGDQNAALSRFGTSFTIELTDNSVVKLVSSAKVKDTAKSVTLEPLDDSTNIGDDLELTTHSFEIK